MGMWAIKGRVRVYIWGKAFQQWVGEDRWENAAWGKCDLKAVGKDSCEGLG